MKVLEREKFILLTPNQVEKFAKEFPGIKVVVSELLPETMEQPCNGDAAEVME